MKGILFLITLLMSYSSYATVNFIEIEPISIEGTSEAFLFKFKKIGQSEMVNLEVIRRMSCLPSDDTLGKNTIEEYNQAYALLTSKVRAGKVFTFGFDSLSANKPNTYWAINLKTFNSSDNKTVRSINASVGTNLCPYKSL